MRAAYAGILPLVIAVNTALSPLPAAAQSTAGAASLQIPPDVRSEGMGRVFATLDRSAYAAWGNPGALGLVRGLDAVGMSARLVPDLADDVVFDYQSLVFGIGFHGENVPFIVNLGVNRTHLSYGESVNPNPDAPDPLDTFESYEKAAGFTVGIGVADLVGAGIGAKWVDVDLAGGLLPPGYAQAEATALDFGFYARTPAIKIPNDGTGPAWSDLRFLGAVAWANYGSGVGFGFGRTDPLPEVRREALGMEFRLLPASRLFPTSNRWLGRLLREAHLLSVSGAFGREKSLVASSIPDSVRNELSFNDQEGIVTGRGLEVRFLDVLAIRTGYVFDDPGEIKGSTFGWGLSWLGYAGVDYARIPQYRELSDVTKWSFWFRLPFDVDLN